MSVSTGQMLGRYQLLERLGHGGTAEVYKAFHPQLQRFVAIKVLHPHLAGTPDFAGRFLREARVIAQLHHPNIVQVFDFDADAERQYMVMEYIAGVSLKDRLDECYNRGEQMPIAEVLRIFEAVLSAAGYAHAQGMVHRDLKPANVLLELTGRPVLTDFGIARLLGGERLTGSGVTVGTPVYMSPEQGQGRPTDERSDIYALGVMLYECLSGQVPFDADTSVALILKHINEPVPPLSTSRPDLPAPLEAIVNKALAKHPEDRFQTAGELWAALAALPEAAGLSPSPAAGPSGVPATTTGSIRPVSSDRPERPQPPRSRPARPLWIAAALVVVAGLLSLGFLAARQWAQPNAAQQSITAGQASLAAAGYQLAADDFTRALQLEPGNVTALRGRAQAYEQLGQVLDAVADIEAALQSAPEDASLYAERARLNVQYGLADASVVLADLDHALAVVAAPDEAHVHFVRGWAILNFPLVDDQPNAAAALPDLQLAAAQDARNPEVHFTLAQAWLATQKPDEALSAANRAVELDPNAWVYRKLRAHVTFVQGDLYAALDDLSAALQLQPDTAGAATLYAERAYVQHRLKRAGEAAADLAEAQTLAPAAPLTVYTALVIDPSSPRPADADLSAVRDQAPDDPLWQAIFAELLDSP